MKVRAPKDGPGPGYPYKQTDKAPDIVRNWVTADGKNAPADIAHYFKEWNNAQIAGSIVSGWRLPRGLYDAIVAAVQAYREGLK